VRRLLARTLPLLVLAACADTSTLAPDTALDPRLGAGGNGNGAAVLVTTASDAGPGSLRDAIARTNADPGVRQIVIQGSVRTIALQGGLVYTGAQALRIVGNTATLDAANVGGTALLATGGGDLTVLGLTVRNAGGEGIAVEVPAGRTGTQSLTLQNVLIENNRGHGVLVNDQADPSTPEDANGEPLQPNPEGSAASVRVTLVNTQLVHNGYSVSDRDGLRVNEGGAGDLELVAHNVIARDNAADGIELDERGAGDVRVDVTEVRLVENGRFDPEDLDDGFDIDEANEGSIVGTVRDTRVTDNFEEGLDFNENNLGDLRVDFTNVVVTGSGEEGIDLEEDDETVNYTMLGGDIVTTMVNVTATGNGTNGGDGGIKIREKAAGNLSVVVDGVVASANAVDGINIREDADGTLTATVRNATTTGNGAGFGGARRGLVFDERGAGNLVATVSGTTSTGNTGAGLHANQQASGTGSLLLTTVTLLPNGGDATTGNVVPIIAP
jgi:hypothetical protein